MYCEKCGKRLNPGETCETCSGSDTPESSRQYHSSSESKDYGGCFGIGGIVVSVITAVLYFIIFMVIGAMSVEDPAWLEDEGVLVLIGFSVLFLLAINLFTLVLSIIGIVVGKKRLLPIIATALTAVEIFGITFILIIGALAE